MPSTKSCNAASMYVEFKFAAINEGTRPGKDVLVTIEAKGAFMVMPRPYRDPAAEDQPPEPLALPLPPSVPRGVWTPGGFFEHLAAQMKSLAGFGNPFGATAIPVESLLRPPPAMTRMLSTTSRRAHPCRLRDSSWNASNGGTVSSRKSLPAKFTQISKPEWRKGCWNAGYTLKTCPTPR